MRQLHTLLAACAIAWALALGGCGAAFAAASTEPSTTATTSTASPRYTQVWVEPLVLLPTLDQGPEHFFKSGEPARIAAYFQESLTHALHEQHIATANAPGAGVAKLTITVVDVVQEKSSKSFIDYMPLKALFNFTRSAIGKAPYQVRLSMIIRCAGSQFDDVLGESFNFVTTKRTKSLKAEIDLPWMKDSIDHWTHDIAQQITLTPGLSR